MTLGKELIHLCDILSHRWKIIYQLLSHLGPLSTLACEDKNESFFSALNSYGRLSNQRLFSITNGERALFMVIPSGGKCICKIAETGRPMFLKIFYMFLYRSLERNIVLSGEQDQAESWCFV